MTSSGGCVWAKTEASASARKVARYTGMITATRPLCVPVITPGLRLRFYASGSPATWPGRIGDTWSGRVTRRIEPIARINLQTRDGGVMSPPDSVDMRLDLHVHTYHSGQTTIYPLASS